MRSLRRPNVFCFQMKTVSGEDVKIGILSWLILVGNACQEFLLILFVFWIKLFSCFSFLCKKSISSSHIFNALTLSTSSHIFYHFFQLLIPYFLHLYIKQLIESDNPGEFLRDERIGVLLTAVMSFCFLWLIFLEVELLRTWKPVRLHLKYELIHQLISLKYVLI